MEMVDIEPITKIEGHGKIRFFVEDGKLRKLQLSIIESPRFFEKFLEGKPAEDAPRLSERICGICPVAHTLASVKAVEDAWSVDVPETAVKLRRLMHLGGFIHSHILHLAFLALPDLLDVPGRDFIGVYMQNPELVEKCVKLRYVGQRIVEIVGGRAIHPVKLVPGGLSKPLTGNFRTEMLDLVVKALKTSQEFTSTLFKLMENNPKLLDEYSKLKTYYIALTNKGVHEIYDGKIRVMSPNGQVENDFSPRDYLSYIGERTVAHSYVKYPFVKLPDGRKELYRVGSLARLNVTDELPTPVASEFLDRYIKLFGRPTHNTAGYNLARAVELVHANELAVELLKTDDLTRGDVRCKVSPRKGTGVGVVEAPRGTLFHHYETDANGYIKRVNIIVATGQNVATMEKNLIDLAESVIPNTSIKEAEWMLERLVRAYDPCISCATHIVEIHESSL